MGIEITGQTWPPNPQDAGIATRPSHPALSRQNHRPWPIPTRRWAWRQSWLELLFAHWPAPAEVVAPLLPPGLELDLWDGAAWLGVVPFRMEGVSRRPLPDLPGVSAFPELNVRTYVSRQGKPGVWFLSLDAANRLAVWAARRWFHLPYHHARMSVVRDGDALNYRSHRSDGGADFAGRYWPTGPPRESVPGTPEHWLTERYCLYAPLPGGGMTRTEVHHAPWPLQVAEAAITQNTMAAPHGLACDGPPTWLHYAERVDVVVWSPERLAE